jgi:hypothetical protein
MGTQPRSRSPASDQDGRWRPLVQISLAERRRPHDPDVSAGPSADRSRVAGRGFRVPARGQVLGAGFGRSCSTAVAIPPAITICPLLLSAIDPSNGSVMYSGSMTAPGIALGVEK